MEEDVQAEGPPGISKDDIEYEASNPNLARAIPRGEGRTLAERMDAVPQSRGTYPDIVEGSDSERTGTSWGVEGVEEGAAVGMAEGERSEGADKGDAAPNRNTASRFQRDDLQNVGSWSTIETDDSAGSPSGNS